MGGLLWLLRLLGLKVTNLRHGVTITLPPPLLHDLNNANIPDNPSKRNRPNNANKPNNPNNPNHHSILNEPNNLRNTGNPDLL